MFLSFTNSLPLFRCPWTEAVWFGCGLTFWIKEYPINAADKWFEELLCGKLAKETTVEVVGLIFQVCWAIWKARNDCIFNGVMPKPERTIDQAKRANSDYLQASFEGVKERTTNPNRVVKWSPPPPLLLNSIVMALFRPPAA